MDFDYVCQRPEPSVACMVYPMVGGDSKQNFYWGHKEVLVPGANSTFLQICILISRKIDTAVICHERKNIARLVLQRIDTG